MNETEFLSDAQDVTLQEKVLLRQIHIEACAELTTAQELKSHPNLDRTAFKSEKIKSYRSQFGQGFEGLFLNRELLAYIRGQKLLVE